MTATHLSNDRSWSSPLKTNSRNIKKIKSTKYFWFVSAIRQGMKPPWSILLLKKSKLFVKLSITNYKWNYYYYLWNYHLHLNYDCNTFSRHHHSKKFSQRGQKELGGEQLIYVGYLTPVKTSCNCSCLLGFSATTKYLKDFWISACFIIRFRKI